MTMIVVTHEMGFAQKIAHCILFMDERRIIEEGAPNTFFRYPRQGRARLFLRKIVVH
jgi:ABC-type polar amino acid transport system ATPase subunit